jgi:N-acetylmuramoyl-L-alanine amidase
LIGNLSYGQSENFKVALDAGHGAHDFGASYNGHVEKNIALAVVLKVGKILEANSRIDVIYTRKTDVFIDLVERANIANRANATIFVSIHCNASRNTAADGTETYVMGMTKIASNLEAAKKENSVITLEKDYKTKYEGFDPNAPETMIGLTLMQEEYLENSIALASKVENQFEALGKKIRGGGVKQAPYMVLHKAYMPRVLVEMGFISNYTEGNILDSEEGQNEIAKAISDAIISYKNEYYGNEGEENNSIPAFSSGMTNNRLDLTEPITEKKIDNTVVKTNIVTAKVTTTYKVQIAASSKKIALQPQNFKGLRNTSVDFINGVYMYYYGETIDYKESIVLLEEAKRKGFNSAYLIAIRDGKKISIQEAIK